MKFTHFLLLSSLVLTGCVMTPATPTYFGVPENQWHQLTPEQQNEVIRGYNQRQQQKTANAPYMAAIGMANSLANQSMADRRTRDNQKAFERMGFPAMPAF